MILLSVLYEYDTLFLTIKEGQCLKMFSEKVLRKFGPKREE
jgi:hypothetical protein